MSENNSDEAPLDFGNEQSNALDFGTEVVGDNIGEAFTKDVTDRDIFRLGKNILLTICLLFVAIGATRIIVDPTINGIKEVWEYAKVFLSSIVSLILGYYFGDKKKGK